MTDAYEPNSTEMNELIDLIDRLCREEKLDFRSYIRGVFARERGDPTDEAVTLLLEVHRGLVHD